MSSNKVITQMPESFLAKKLAKIINARMTTASPLRVSFLTHDLATKSESNQEAAGVLLKEKHTTLHHLSEGDLNLYADAIVLITKDPKFPIKFFCDWKHIMFKKMPAIQTKQIWCDQEYRNLRIEGSPLGGFCLFNILLPKYKIVVGSDEHTADGERAAKNHAKHALKQGIYVYVKDEHNDFYDLKNHEILEQDANLFWGTKPEYKERLLIFSTENLFPL
jgi:hypothetical protein